MALTKANESQYMQCGVTPHFSTGQNLLKKILRKDRYWPNQLGKLLIDPLTTNYAINHDSLTLTASYLELFKGRWPLAIAVAFCSDVNRRGR